MCVTAITSGCGKTLENSKANTGDKITRTPGAQAGSIELVLNTQSSSGRVEYLFNQNSQISIPASVKANGDFTQSFDARIYFNIRGGEYDFFCDYKTQSSQKGQEHLFIGCFADIDPDTPGAENLQYYPGQWEFQDKGNTIELEFHNLQSNSEISIFTDIEVDWH